MIRRLVRRLCTALIVATLAAGLPMQAAQGTATAAHMALAPGADLAVPPGCDGREDGAAPEAGCPAAFCLAPAVVGDKPAFAPKPAATPCRRDHVLRLGLSPTPDPFPPRPGLLS